MSWILLTVGAQFINAVVAIIDKRIVTDEKMMPKPFIYAFYTCLISGVWIVLYVFNLLPIPALFDWLNIPTFANVHTPTLEVIALAYLAAYTFFMGLVSMFTALQAADAADVVPVIGATSAVASFGLGHFFLGGVMSANFGLGIFILAFGTFLVSRYNFTVSTALTAVHAGIFFAFHYVVIKGLFNVTNFDDAFFWSRIAFMLFAVSLLMIPTYYRKIAEQTKSTTKSAGALILTNKILAGVSTIIILKATDMGDVAAVQALGGLQFVFILLLGIFFTVCPDKNPNCESYHRGSILRKAIFVAVIAVGFLVLFKG